jgi:hypothetical protein
VTSLSARAGQLLATRKMLASTAVKSHPSLFYPIADLRESDKRRLVRRSTDVVVEGYWRSANHFAVHALQTSQKKPIEIAHHFHAPAQLMLALRWNIPALLLIREPAAAVASAMVGFGVDDPSPLMQVYVAFHKPLMGVRDDLVVGEFQQTTSDFGAVIDMVNRRYGAHLDSFDGGQIGIDKVSASITTEHETDPHHQDRIFPLPSADRAAMTNEALARVRSEVAVDLMSEASSLYDYFLS